MHDFDSYTLYEIKKRNLYSVRIKVVLTEIVDGDILEAAAVKAFKRFPYYSRTVAVDEDDAYILVPCSEPITVVRGDHVVNLGTEETNNLLFAITYDDDHISFIFAHNFCGGCGAMRWIKATLWQYLTDVGHDIKSEHIMTMDTPMTEAEEAQPDVDLLPKDQPLGNLNFATDSFTLMADYMEFMKAPEKVMGYYPIDIPKKELMHYARGNDGSPNSIIAAALFKMLTKVFPEESKLSCSIACNYREDVGCPETYRDIVRQLYVPYDSGMRDWPIEKLSTITRSRMYIQMQPEVSWSYCRKMNDFRSMIDAQPDLESKVDYAVDHSPTTHFIPATTHISYVGKIEWGGLAPYIKGVYSLTFGHVMIEVNATEDNFCISFQTLRKDGKYLKEFLEVLDEEGIEYSVGEFEDRMLPNISLPTV